MKLKFLKATLASLVLACTSVSATVIDIDFTALNDAGQFNTVANQSKGSMSVVNDILTLHTNAWFSVDLIDAAGVSSLNYEDTILSFDFLATGISEIAGISTATSADIANLGWSNAFKILGTQNWGKFELDYTTLNDWVHFDINLGQYSSGDSFTKILFANDCDACSGLDIDVSFKNMTLTQVPEPTTMALFALATFGLVSRRVKK